VAVASIQRVGLLPLGRQNRSVLLLVLRKNVPESIAAIARAMASPGDAESAVVTNACNLAEPVAIKGLPLLRVIRARHRPGSRSNAWIENRLYSTVSWQNALLKRAQLFA
jgi:hypothetical protein